MLQERNDVRPAPARSGGDEGELRQRLDELEREVATLRDGLESRQRIGFTTGVLAQRYGVQPEEAWRLLAHVSQDLNVKARRVSEVLLDAYCGRLSPEDAALAGRIARLLPTAERRAAVDGPTAGAVTAGG